MKLKNFDYKLNEKSDIYSLGGDREKPIVGTPSSFVRLYSKCWDADPSLRPNADETLRQLQSLSLESVYDGSNLANNNSNRV
ncbi:9980_t:CDS:2, partial [Acaulospora colombiana]